MQISDRNLLLQEKGTAEHDEHRYGNRVSELNMLAVCHDSDSGLPPYI